MAYSKIEREVCDMAEPIASENGCYVYDVEYVKEGASRYLRVYADKEDGGISIDECEAISRALSDELDRRDPIKEDYMLEVSSPGIERRLKRAEHFMRYIGETVDVGLYKAIDGSKNITARLCGFDDESGAVTLDTDSGEITLKKEEMSYVKLHFDF